MESKGRFKKGMIPWNKGTKMWENRSHPKGALGKPAWNKGKKVCLNTGKTHFKKGTTPWNKGVPAPWAKNLPHHFKKGHIPMSKTNPEIMPRGENSSHWIKDRTKLAKQQERNDMAYKEWRSQVKKRDGKCRLQNENCSGYLIVHHILGWTAYPAERYNVDNGITLCQGHHPRKRVEEKQLVPVFQQLINQPIY